jgi:hypothetical protein
MFENLAIAVAIITGLTQVVKKAGVSTRYIPLVAVLFGIIYGLAVMGLEKIDFFWYLKKISLLALLGYFGGAIVYWIMFA